MKSGTVDYVGGGTPHAKVGTVGLLGESPHIGEMYQFGVLVGLLLFT